MKRYALAASSEDSARPRPADKAPTRPARSGALAFGAFRRSTAAALSSSGRAAVQKRRAEQVGAHLHLGSRQLPRTYSLQHKGRNNHRKAGTGRHADCFASPALGAARGQQAADPARQRRQAQGPQLRPRRLKARYTGVVIILKLCGQPATADQGCRDLLIQPRSSRTRLQGLGCPQVHVSQSLLVLPQEHRQSPFQPIMAIVPRAAPERATTGMAACRVWHTIAALLR
jgi:hypothetical protein